MLYYFNHLNLYNNSIPLIICPILSDFLTKNGTNPTGMAKINLTNNLSTELVPKNFEIMHHLIKATGKNADKKYIPGAQNSP